MSTGSRPQIQSFKVKGSSGNVYLIERIDDPEAASGTRNAASGAKAFYRVASSHMYVVHNAADDTFTILGSGEILRRI